MFSLIAGLVLLIAAYWLWGVRKMVRMNNDPGQLMLANLLLRAGAGDDAALLRFIREEQWTQVQIADRVAHALSLAQKIFAPVDYFGAKTYASALRDRYQAFEAEQRVRSLAGLARNDAQLQPNVPHVESLRSGENDQHGIDTETKSQRPPPIRERQGFQVNEFVVYPAHGVGQILAIEKQEIAGAPLELFVINFIKDKMTLRVPTAKVANVGMRKLSDPDSIQEAYRVLNQQPQTLDGMWSERAQEYEAKINSGTIVAIAEVVRDLYRPTVGKEQSYGERQLYDAAIDRLSREIAIVEHLTEEEAIKQCESLMIASGILGGRGR